MHERQQRKRRRQGTGVMLRKQASQPNGLQTQIAADDLPMRRVIARVEEQVDDGVHATQARLERTAFGCLRVDLELTQTVSGALQALAHVGFAEEERRSDLAHAKAAQGLEREHELRFDGDPLVATYAEQRQCVVE